jgi:ribosome biogenesis GTPase / thiamine phosphate phosphatase
MNEDKFARLRDIGLAAAVAREIEQTCAAMAGSESQPSPPLVPMRVAEVHRETLQLHDGDGEHTARMLPRLARSLLDAADALVVGDWVLVHSDAHGRWWVHARVAPLNHLTRRDGQGRRHPVVSNVDTALLVMGLDGDFNPRRLERYLALVHGTGVLPVVVLTKRDIAAPTQALLDEKLDLLRGRLSARIDMLAVDATSADAARQLAPYCGAGQTLVMLGSSGAGKSTLTNSLLGAQVQDTGGVREHDSRGKHTTTSRSLHRLPGGACVIDTPGVRTLRADSDEAAVAASFEDIQRLAQQCRFRDCTHADEPGCAVRHVVHTDRLRNYHKLKREMQRDTMSALQRREQVAKWKVLHRAGAARAKAKRGD